MTIDRPLHMVDLKGQYRKIKSEVDKAIIEVVESGYFINGPSVKEFACNLAGYNGSKYVVPCGNGTDALQIALMALDLKPGDEVITCPFTFAATVEVISLLGLKPVFVDVHEDTMMLDETKLEAAITSKTKAIIPVHLFGQVANMEAIMQIATQHNIAVVEDNAQAIGADYTFSDGTVKKAGAIGHIGTTSFFPSKNLGCFGDGGAIFTDDEHLYKRLNMIVNHGMKVRYYHDDIGVNSRLDSIQAAVLDIKLKHLNQYNQLRQAAANRYDELLHKFTSIKTPYRAKNSSHVFHQYTLQLENGRDELAAFLKQEKVPFGIYYPVPLHLQKAYSEYGYQKGDMPVSEKLSEKVISLPMHTELDEELQNFIVKKLEVGMQTVVNL